MMLRLGLVEPGWTFIFQIVNTLILFLVLKKLLFKPVTEMMENRSQGIADSIQEAEDKKKEAEGYKEEYLLKLENADKEGSELIRKAVVKAEERANQIKKEAEEEIARLKEKAEKEIAMEKEMALVQLKDEIASLAVLAASKVIEKDVDVNSHKVLINQFIEEVGDTKWQN
jgi:F-type H+-transporting ATPase subunit b